MKRYRRLRTSPTIRKMVQEAALKKSDLITPIFVMEGENLKIESSAMPDFFTYSLDRLPEELETLQSLGLKSILLFGVPGSKDSIASSAFDPDGIVQRAIKVIKAFDPSFCVITDVCMCQYTDHGHCGILSEDGIILNDETLPYMAKIALSHAEAGADIVAPSDMMDGRIEAIRDVLDDAGYTYVPIMAYSLKFCSNYYGPFRTLADSSPKSGSRDTYQMDYHNAREALDVAYEAIESGADFIMVKPAMMYMDLIHTLKDNIPKPIVCYNVSGEYALIKNGIAQGLVNENIIYETLIGFKRAGADLIITYFSKFVAEKWLND
ncbi:porphobilinogen synthase [Fusibacter paucivorans]|uniref:Delta-aminolevulinic acid dehydratase n=1 Tax=Fusibacter paucivorans TaxID=76009 RepID=A0ABS5PQH8_9FIRM|nr:porphobilinogen synthase [Fusibacter paucivorans]MBS7527152.1 porphobilinogen synthase [Fusibacter paucivorans]